MDINQFVALLRDAVVEGVLKAPPKPTNVVRANGKVQQLSLGQLMAEMTDQLIIANNLEREHLKLIREQIDVIQENTDVGRKLLKKNRRRRDDDDDDYEDDR